MLFIVKEPFRRFHLLLLFEYLSCAHQFLWVLKQPNSNTEQLRAFPFTNISHLIKGYKKRISNFSTKGKKNKTKQQKASFNVNPPGIRIMCFSCERFHPLKSSTMQTFQNLIRSTRTDPHSENSRTNPLLTRLPVWVRSETQSTAEQGW